MSAQMGRKIERRGKGVDDGHEGHEEKPGDWIVIGYKYHNDRCPVIIHITPGLIDDHTRGNR